MTAMAGLVLAASQGCRSKSASSPPATRAGLVTPQGAITNTADDLRTGWYPNQPKLDPSTVAGPTFGRLWRTTLPLASNEQVYAQPLVVNGTVFVATEANNIYSLNAETGAVLASRALGPAWPAAQLACNDLVPIVGITGTPVIDAATNTAYFVSKTYINGSPSVANTVFYAHAVDATTLTERQGFPVLIQGAASNDAGVSFIAQYQAQRPGLLFMNGVVYAAFGAHCDAGNYRGWVVGISTSGQIRAMFATEVGAVRGAAIWQSGGGLVSDAPGRIFFTTGNAVNAPADETPRASPPDNLAEAVVRLNVQPDGSLAPADFFAPYNRATLDAADTDLGAGGPVALPSAQFGTAAHPSLLVAGGKEGRIYVLDRNNLGGFKQGPSAGDNILSDITFAPMWQRPGVWPGDGGYIYAVAAFGRLKAFKYGVNGSGNPIFSSVGITTETFGYGTGSPIITSNGTAAGSALLWVLYTTGSLGNGQLRAYDAVPNAAGNMVLRFSDAFGTQAKFSVPGVGDGRLYVGTADGAVLGYGAPTTEPLSSPPLDFGQVVVGSSRTANVTLTANQNLTVTALSTSGAGFTMGAPSQPLPATLATGGTLTVPITFSPTNATLYAGTLNVTSSAGSMSVPLNGKGQSATPVLAAMPTMVSFGGLARGTSSTSSVVLSNVGAQTLTWNGFTQPSAPFTLIGLPAPGTTLAPSASVTVSVKFAPTANGSYSDSFTASSTGGDVSVFLSGSATDPPVMSIAPMALDFGGVSLGASASLSFTVSNTGGSDLTITKSKPPALGVFVAQTALEEGTVIAAGSSRTLTIKFMPAEVGAFNDQWIITGNDGSGVQTVTFTGSGQGAGDGGAPPDAGGGGITIVMGEPNVLSVEDYDNGGYLIAQPATLAQAGTLNSLSLYNPVASGKLRLAVYDATGPGGGPGAKRAETGEITPVVGWNTANVTTPVALPAGAYWLAHLPSQNGLHTRRAGSGSCKYYFLGYGPMPLTFSPNALPCTDHWSFYGTLNASVASNQAPVVATAAAASPNPVTGTTTSLSVLGADDGGEAALRYTWATTGSPPAPVSFSQNGNNAAKNTVATFTQVGTYSLGVTISDGQLSAASNVSVTVNVTLTSIAVAPSSATVLTGNTQQFTAAARDQFGALLASQPSFSWSVSGGGTISSSGLFTAGSAAGGPFTVSASSGGKTGTASVTVSQPANQPPTVATAAAASPNPATGTTTNLSVLGADDGGEAALRYTWATTGSPPAPVSFSPNASNAAKSAVATFTKAGAYALAVTISDGQSSVASSVSVTVSPTLTSVTVAPPNATVVTSGTQAFTATGRDQFGVALSPQPSFTWSVSGGGAISSSGLFTAGGVAGGPFTVAASSGAKSGTAAVTVTAATPITIGETTTFPVEDYDNGSYLIAQPTTLGQTASLQSLSMYNPVAAGKLRLGLYDATGPGGRPGAKLAETPEITPVVGWNTANVIAPVTLPAGNYWLVHLPSDNGLHTRRAGSGSCVYYFFPYAVLPATFSTAPLSCTDRWSLYGTLTP